MKYLDLTLHSPAENLACDEALLDSCDATGEGGVLRFFESPTVFVVAGYGNRIAVEADLEACAGAGVPVLRRISGGGTVVLGPGCLAYAVVLPIDSAPEFATVSGANRRIMGRLREVVEQLAGRPVRVEGHTDLTLEGRKCGGNAQRRKRRTLLFHGTLLLHFDLSLVARLLRMPSAQPGYRAHRGHLAFLTNLNLDMDEVKVAIRRAWGATEPWVDPLDERIARLMSEQYGSPEWHARR